MATDVNLPLGIVDALYSYFIYIGNHQQCISTLPKLKRYPGTDNCDLKTLAIALVGPILNGLSNFNMSKSPYPSDAFLRRCGTLHVNIQY